MGWTSGRTEARRRRGRFSTAIAVAVAVLVGVGGTVDAAPPPAPAGEESLDPPTLTVTVLDDGSPVDGATVSSRNGSLWGTTDATGEVTFTSFDDFLAERWYLLDVFEPGVWWESAADAYVLVEPGDNAITIEYGQRAPETLVIEVVDSESNPRVGLDVYIDGDPGTGWYSDTGMTDADGIAALQAVPGTYTIYITGLGEEQILDDVVATDEAPAAPLQVVMDPPALGSLVITVTEEGSPVDGVEVSVLGPSSGMDYTDTGGVVAFDPLLPGTYNVTVYDWSRGTVALRSVEVGDDGPTELAIALAFGDLDVVVTDTAGTVTFPGVQIRVNDAATGTFLGLETTGGDGVASFPDLPVGDVIVTVTKFGLEQPATVVADATSTVTFAEPLGSLEVTILDEDGSPLQGADVWISSTSYGDGGWTDADGSVVLPAVPADDYELVVRDTSWTVRAVQQLTIPEGAPTTLTIQLQPLVDFDVVVTRDGAPEPNAWVHLLGFVGENTDEFGVASFTGVAPGTYTLQVQTSAEGFAAWQTVEITPGIGPIEVAVAFGDLEVTVVDQHGPFAWLDVHLPEVGLWGWADDDGIATIPDLPAGEWTVELRWGNAVVAATTVEVVADELTTTTVDIVTRDVGVTVLDGGVSVTAVGVELGWGWGVTGTDGRALLERLPVGAYQLFVWERFAGFDVAEVGVEVSPGDDVLEIDVPVTMPAGGSITFSVSLAGSPLVGAEVYLGFTDLGTTGDDGSITASHVPAGTYQYEVIDDGRLLGSGEVEVTVGSDQTIMIEADPANVTVVVTDPSDAPVADATVMLGSRFGWTGADGAVTFTDVLAGAGQTLSVWWPEWNELLLETEVDIEPGDNTVPVTVTFPPTRAVDVLVVDAADGSTVVPGATVDLGPLTAVTGADGIASFDGVADGERFIAVTSAPPWYLFLGSWSGTIDASTSQPLVVEVTLPPTSDVTVTVVDSDGAPYSPANVDIDAAVDGTVDAGGQIVFTDVPVGTRWVSVTSATNGEVLATVLAEITENDTDVEVVVRFGDLDVVVVDGADEPVEGVRVVVGPRVITTGADGRAAFVDLPALDQWISVTTGSPWNVLIGFAAVTVAEGANDDVTIEVELPQTRDVVVNVSDAEGPVASIPVLLGPVEQTTDSGGSTTFSDVPEESWLLWITTTGYLTHFSFVEVEPTSPNPIVVDLVLTVDTSEPPDPTDPTDPPDPVGDGTVAIQLTGDPDAIGWRTIQAVGVPGANTFSDATGAATLVLPAGAHVVAVYDSELNVIGSAEVTAVADTTVPLEIAVSPLPTGTVEVLVLDGTTPVPNVPVRVGTSWGQTGADGIAVLTSVIVGEGREVVVTTGAPTWTTIGEATVDVVADATVPVTVQATLPERGDVVVTVRDGEGGPPVPGRLVRLDWFASGTTGPDGTYTFHDVIVGSYQARTFSFGGAVLDTKVVEVLADQTVAVDLVITVTESAPPLATVSATSVSAMTNPDTGELDILVPPWNQPTEPITVTFWATCETGDATDVAATLAGSPLTVVHAGGTAYEATLPLPLVSGEIVTTWTCDDGPQEQKIGDVELYDPSGFVTSAATGEPVVGAAVTLWYVPGWEPRTDPTVTGPATCETNESKLGAPWSQPAPTDLGVPVVPDPDVEPGQRTFDPYLNPFVTDDDGYYGWDVAEGCWYVTVEKAGFEPLTSPVVGVPSEVTDLDLEIVPTIAPEPPTGVTVTAGVASTTVSWTASVPNGSMPVVSYTATASPGGATCQTSTTSCTVTGLEHATSYTFTVVARTSTDIPSAASAPSESVLTPDVPGAPTAVVATAGSASATVSWTAPASDGGSPITGYTATASPGGATCATTDATSCTVTGLTNGTSYTFVVAAKNAVGTGPSSEATTVATPTAPTQPPPTQPPPTQPPPTQPPPTQPPGVLPPDGPPGFLSLVPARLMDTRGPGLTVDGAHSGDGPIAAGAVRELPVAGRGGVPEDAAAVSLNVTAVAPLTDGYATVFPCEGEPPNASNLNYVAGQVVPNSVLTKVSSAGTICIFSFAEADFLVDVNGAFSPGDDVLPLTPGRLLDTRGPGLTVDGEASGGGAIAAATVREVQVAGRAGVRLDSGAVSLNVTAVAPDADGYATVFPCGGEPPNASNLNYVAGQVVPNSVMTKLGPAGTVCVFTFAAADFLIDVNASFPAGASFEALAPARVLDTRGPGLTADGEASGGGPIAADEVREVVIAGRSGVPAGAAAVSLNVTAVAPDGPGYATVFPCGGDPPNASNLNYVAGQVVPNSVMTKLGPGGTVCVFTFAAADFLIDVNGYMTG